MEYNLQECIPWCGVLSGEDLTALFNNSDIAVCSLGCHRKSIFLSSELESCDYMAWGGIPMVSSTKIDVLDDSLSYIHYVAKDGNPVDIKSIVAFYNSLKKKEARDVQIQNIRNFAENNCD